MEDLTYERKKELHRFQQVIGVTFKDIYLLEESLTDHTARCSYDNERLEHFGDATLDYVVTRHLIQLPYYFGEGIMTELRSELVKNDALSCIGDQMNIVKYVVADQKLIFNRPQRSRPREHIIGRAVEALIGAIDIDRGIRESELFIQRFILCRLDTILTMRRFGHPKTILKNKVFTLYRVNPRYRVVRKLIINDETHFHVEVLVKNRVHGIGTGITIKEGETNAAINMLRSKVLDSPL